MTDFYILISFLIISLLIGFLAPSFLFRVQPHHPWTWILAQGGVAWLIAFIMLFSESFWEDPYTQQIIATCGVTELIFLAFSAILGNFAIRKSQDKFSKLLN